MNYDKAHSLAADIRASEEYKNYVSRKEAVSQDPNTLGLLKEYKRLELKCQAAMVSGEEDAESMEKLRRLTALLQMNAEASEYLMAEFRLSRMLGDIYRILADAAELDISMLDN
ncbi:MAG: YlbF family regulator [Clostridiales bacterium]|nr:YlbF family regulator [Clostridiales bacterium]